jgi:hypothetical protein
MVIMSKRYQAYVFRHRRPLIPFPEAFWSDTEPLVTFLRTFHTLGNEQVLIYDEALSLLAGLDTRPLTASNQSTALLGRTLSLIVPLIDRRHDQHKRALGGKEHPLEFDPAEIEQTLPEVAQLPTRLDALCRWLLADLWTLLRLVRVARDLFRRKRQEWKLYHRLAGIVLIRLLRVYKRLERLHTPWVAYRCLRWALRQVWGTLFGKPIKLTKDAQSLLKVDALSLGEEWALWYRLKRESKAGGAIPGPFVEMVERWLAGDTPPPYRKQTDKERLAEARFWL